MKTPIAFAVAAAFALPALAQQAGSPPPSWQQGKPAAMSESTLHPFAPHMTGRASKDLPVNTLKVPAGFKVEVWADGIPEARSMAMGDKGTLFVSNRNAKNVYAVVSNGGQREGIPQGLHRLRERRRHVHEREAPVAQDRPTGRREGGDDRDDGGRKR